MLICLNILIAFTGIAIFALSFIALNYSSFLVQHVRWLLDRSIDTSRAPLPIPLLAAIASFTVTAVALLIGHLASPEDHVPQTLRLIVINAGCDTATLLFTFWILRQAAEKSRLPLLLAVVIDLGVSAMLACVSLWLSLAGTPEALSLGEVGRVLIGLEPDGSRLGAGPYFWVMHTTFLPTLAFLMFLLSTLVAKYVVLPLNAVWEKTSTVDEPDKLTAGLMGFWAVVFGSLAALVRWGLPLLYPPQ